MTQPRYVVQGQEVVPASPATGAGRYNPYRGVDVHGVTSPDVWQDVAAPDTATAEVVVNEEPPAQEPVPVRIVGESGSKELRTHAVGTVPIKPSGEISNIVGRHSTRTSVKVVNTGTVVVYIVNGRSGTTFNGYPIPVNGSETFTDEDAIYAVNDGTATAGQVSYLEFFSVSDN